MREKQHDIAHADGTGAARAPSAGYALLFAARRVPTRMWVIVALVVVAFAAAATSVFLFAGIDWGAVIARIGRWRAGLLIPAMAVLPLFGFPILPVYLVAGLRFGAIGGGGVVALATAAHLAGSYLIARSFLRGPLEKMLARWHAHLPEIPPDEELAVAFIAALVPGIPYVVRNYLYPIIGLRLRGYFWIALPIYVARSYVSVLMGDLGTAPNRSRFLILAGVEMLKVVICAVIIWWLRAHHRRVHGEPARGA